MAAGLRWEKLLKKLLLGSCFEETKLAANRLTLLVVFSGPAYHYIYPDRNGTFIIDHICLCDGYLVVFRKQEPEGPVFEWFFIDEMSEDLNLPIILPSR